MFTEESFDVFAIDGLDERMAAIRAVIQPVFQELDDSFKALLEKEVNEALFVHIAQHRRRTVYPPENTWSAISRKKRGYKMEPHFQLGIFPDYVFMWLSFIDNPKNEKEMAQAMLDKPRLFGKLPEDTMVSFDHTIDKVERLTDVDLTKGLTRFRDVKKGEFQIGRIIPKESELWQKPEAAKEYMWATYQSLLPIYHETIGYSPK
ncbi:hypothetical protein BAU15_08215 [Enterococcus sp. JM4C]|uniref:DUF1054 domain-containing protein n=1 Tax=Candidatus Enterococcus huntleyi TaxID=1857217 RepID=UPI001379A329|nr:DUF1054 domain-containing protein [Enterococcus sp. JM4C]KAF1297879.1 hypothetical protein BAU15_08215 [Enterococcus sp. JM4C]